jgi:hypothetical protein
MSNHERHGSPPPGGDDLLDRAWREASDDQPPAQLDAAIIAASRKAVADSGAPGNTVTTGRAPSRNWLTRWQPLAAAATVAGLSVVLVQMLPRDVPDDRPTPGASRSVSSAEREAVAEQAPAPGAGPATPAAPLAPPSVSAEAGADRREAVALEQAGQLASAPAAALPRARAREHAKAAAPDAAAWAARIVTRHAAGELAAAADALQAFRAVDPEADRYLPDSLRDWAATVP